MQIFKKIDQKKPPNFCHLKQAIIVFAADCTLEITSQSIKIFAVT